MRGILVLLLVACRGRFEALPDAVPDAARTYRSVVLEDGPIAYYRLDETGGTVAHDLVAGLDGTIAPGCVLGVPGATSDGDAAIQFDGTSCQIAVPDAFAFPGLAPFTIEAWLATQSDTLFHQVWSHQTRDTQNPIDGYAMLVSPGGFEVERVIASSNAKTLAVPLPSEPFVHVVAVYDGTQLLMYVDGVLGATKSDTRALAPVSVQTLIGGSVAGNKLLGTADEVAVYGHALPPDRIALHHAMATAP